jgi:plastocyanin
MKATRIMAGIAGMAALSAVAGSAVGAEPAAPAAAPGANRPGPTWAEFERLQAEVREQRQLLIQIVQTEQQRFDMLMRLMQGSGSGAPAVPPSALLESHDARGSTLATTAPRTSEPVRHLGTVEGKVNVPGGDTNDLYVYVDDIRAPVARGRSIEIKQENKQFVPRVAVVTAGTTISFPNLDPVFHNVFSNSARNSFDLGSYNAGDKARSAVFSAPGVVDIFCNMHQRMSAHVLVVPSKLYARVNRDGTFKLENVPAGARTLVAWSPSLKPAQQRVEVQSGGASRATFEMEYTDNKTHTNKFGQPYGSYKE